MAKVGIYKAAIADVAADIKQGCVNYDKPKMKTIKNWILTCPECGHTYEQIGIYFFCRNQDCSLANIGYTGFRLSIKHQIKQLHILSPGAREYILANLKHPLWQKAALKDIETLKKENEDLKKKLQALRVDMESIIFTAGQSLKGSA